MPGPSAGVLRRDASRTTGASRPGPCSSGSWGKSRTDPTPNGDAPARANGSPCSGGYPHESQQSRLPHRSLRLPAKAPPEPSRRRRLRARSVRARRALPTGAGLRPALLRRTASPRANLASEGASCAAGAGSATGQPCGPPLSGPTFSAFGPGRGGPCGVAPSAGRSAVVPSGEARRPQAGSDRRGPAGPDPVVCGTGADDRAAEQPDRGGAEIRPRRRPGRSSGGGGAGR